MSDVLDPLERGDEKLEVQIVDEEIPEEGENPISILSEEVQSQIKAYLSRELGDLVKGEDRKNFMDDVETWRRHREARPAEREKDFPWPGASNVCIPMAMQETNAIYSMMKSNFSAKKPMWSAESLSGAKGDKDHAKVIEGLLNFFSEGKNYTNLRAENNKIFYDLVSLGTQFVKTAWTTEERRFKKEDSTGTLVDAVRVVKDCPTVQGIRLDNFYTRLEWNDIQACPYIAERIYRFDYEMKEREKRGIYTNIDKLLSSSGVEVDFDENKEAEIQRMGGKVPSINGRLVDFFEVYLYWDINDDGYDEDIIVWYDLKGDCILRAQYNTLGERPYKRFVYIERPNSLYGIGVGWIVQSLQEEMDGLHNMRNDGVMISILQMYITKRGGGIGPNEKFFPLKNISVDDPKNDFIPVKFPDVSYTTLQAELMTKEYADRATGASDAMMGFESKSAGTRQTASGTMFLASQGSKIFTAIMENTIEEYNALGMSLIYHMAEKKDKLMEYVKFLPEELQAIAPAAIAALDVENAPGMFQFKIQTTDIEKSEDARKQSMLTLMQLYSMYSEKILQLYPLVYSPQAQIPNEVRDVGTRLIMGNTKLMDRVFDFFGEKEPEDYLPYIKDIEIMVEAIDALKDQKISKIRETQENGNQPNRIGQAPAGNGGFSPQPGMGGSQGAYGPISG